MKGSILRDRLIAFAVDISDLAQDISATTLGQVLGNQMIRASTSAALNHGEATSSRSRRELAYKLGIVLREIREIGNALQIILLKGTMCHPERVTALIKESDELCAMLYTSIRTTEGYAKRPSQKDQES